ncbi:MAG TPA: hypothetical protein VFG30_40705 [Polyangiales bacterium]|nr:hypothetical protein [Polyangiales bacterium]
MAQVRHDNLLAEAERVADQRRPSFEVISASDGLGIAEVGSVCLVVWRSAVVRERFLRQRAALTDFTTRHRSRAGFVTVIEPDAPPPEDAIRKASIEMIATLSGQLACVACVIEGDGFRAAATRSVLSGMALLLPKLRTEVKYLATVAAAGTWVSTRCDGVTSAALCQAHDQLRERLTTR